MNTDPWYSAYHYSHPPLVERLQALDDVEKKTQQGVLFSLIIKSIRLSAPLHIHAIAKGHSEATSLLLLLFALVEVPFCSTTFWVHSCVTLFFLPFLTSHNIESTIWNVVRVYTWYFLVRSQNPSLCIAPSLLNYQEIIWCSLVTTL